MMKEEASTKSPESGSSWKECLKLLKGFQLEEVLQVLLGGFCEHCQGLVELRINNLIINEKPSKISPVMDDGADFSKEFHFAESLKLSSSKNNSESSANKSHWQNKLKEFTADSSPASVNSHRSSVGRVNSEILLNDGLGGVSPRVDDGLSEEQKEQIRFSEVVKKKDFVYGERINGKATNVLQGLELHTNVFNAKEQKKIVECVYDLQRMGQKGQFRERTYSEPKKWMRGKGRVTIQFGCCYNYATDKNGNPPGIIRDEEVDPLPPLFKQMIKRMVKWRVLSPTCIPNSCIVNIYDEGDCIPPHIDHHDFLRPFCTVSFLTQCNILFGANLKVVNAGEFSGPVSIPLPCGSVLILNGNGADVAKHCVPGVPGKRISITFRKMDDSKLPYKFSPDPELMGIKPLVYSSSTKVPWQQQNQHDERSYAFSDHSIALSPAQQNNYRNGKSAENESGSHTNNNGSYFIDKDDFPPLGGTSSLSQSRAKKARPKQ